MTSVCFIGDRNIYLKRICNYLVSDGYKISLICRNNYGIKMDEFDNRINIYTLKSNRLLKKIFEIPAILKKIKPDYVHYQYLTKDIILSLVLSNKYKVFATPWGSDLNIFSVNLINRLVINLGLIFCNKIHILSEGIKKKFSKQYYFINKKKLVEIPWGIDFDRFHNINETNLLYWQKRLRISKNNIILLSYRNHKPLYNHHTIIKCLPIVIKKYPAIKCIFTGSNCDLTYLENSKRIVKQLNLQQYVEFIDEWIPDDLLPALINLAQIVISIPFSDGMPATLLEVMATHAIPIIGNLAEYSCFFKDDENGRILNKLEDYEQLADIIIDILENITFLSEKYSKKNNQYIKEKQNWNIQKIKLKNLYNI